MSASTAPNVIQATINYYALQGYYHHIVTLCEKVMKLGRDPVVVFWHSFGHAMQGNLSEALRGFNSIKQRKEMELAAYIGLLYTNRQTTSADEQEINELSTMIEIGVDDASDGTKLQAALFYLFTANYIEARQMMENVDNQFFDKYSSSLSVRGWINLKDNDVTSEDPMPFFEEALKNTPFQGRRDLDALMGMACLYVRGKQFEESIKILNTAIVDFSSFLPALLTKTKIMIALEEWEQADKIVQKILTDFEPDDIEALSYRLLYILTREYDEGKALKTLQQLYRSLSLNEPRNDKLFSHFAECFGVLCQQEELLDVCIDMIESSKKISPRYGRYYYIHGNLLLKSNRLKTAEEVFTKAIEIIDADTENLINDHSESIPANKGLVKALIKQNKVERAVQFLSLLNDVAGDGLDMSLEEEESSTFKHVYSDLKFINALVQEKMSDSEECLRYLDEAIKCHEEEMKNISPSLEFYSKFNPHLLLEIASEYLLFSPHEPLTISDSPSVPLQKATAVLERVVRYVPASLPSKFLYAKVRYLNREYEPALSVVNSCLKVDQKIVEAHLLAAEIFYAQENYTEASNALERAISSNFLIRDWPSYHLLRARVSAATGDVRSAIEVLQKAIKANENGKQKATVIETVALYLELASILTKVNQEIEASKVIEEALERFKNDLENKELVIIANAKLNASKNEIDSALGILSTIPSTSKNFLRAKTEMAYIYLNKRHDKLSYVKCYQEQVEYNPESIAAHISLADAYMTILEPEKAIEVYEQVLTLDDNLITEIGSKIGKALIGTHNYQGAIDYYAEALSRNLHKVSIRMELCELLFKLKQYVQAEKLLIEGVVLFEEHNMELDSMINQVTCLNLLSKIHASLEKATDSINDLMKARGVQLKVLSKLRGAQKDALILQKQVASNICYNIGVLQQMSDTEKAISFYNEALEHDETHKMSLMALSEICLKKGDLNECQNHCLNLLRISPVDEMATVMLAGILFRKNNYTEAIEHFHNFLTKKPDNFSALSQMIRLLRRVGKLELAPQYLENANNTNARTSADPGYHFSSALYHYYTKNYRDAMREFNLARKNREWGHQAIFFMIDIYLDPDTTTLFSDQQGIQEQDIPKTSLSAEDTEANALAAEKLLKELSLYAVDNTSISDNLLKIIEGRIQMSRSKNKSDIEKALPLFVQVLSKEKDNIPALVYMSEALERTKQTPKARNNLKRITKIENPSEEEADDVERGWLLLAGINIEQGKNEMAEELLSKVLKLNKSCSRAWEWRGLIFEKEKNHKEASECYEQAWRLSQERDPGVGFKLAFNYLKSRRYLDAIDVCHKILNSHPRYPRIRKEILDVARASLRP